MIEGSGKSATVAAAETLEGVLKSLLVAPEEAHLLALVQIGDVFILGTQQVHGHGGHNGARPHVGSQHGEDHGFGERNEKKFGNARKKEHGNKYDADTERGNEGGDGDLLSSIKNGLNGFLAHSADCG